MLQTEIIFSAQLHDKRILKRVSAWFNSQSLKTHSFTHHKKIPFWNQLSSSVFKINIDFGLKTLNIKMWHQTHQHIFFFPQFGTSSCFTFINTHTKTNAQRFEVVEVETEISFGWIVVSEFIILQIRLFIEHLKEGRALKHKSGTAGINEKISIYSWKRVMQNFPFWLEPLEHSSNHHPPTPSLLLIWLARCYIL